MPALSAVRAANAAFSPSYLPVALFVGGTSGVGQGTAEAFARHTKGNAHIILCGRNRAGAERIIQSFPKSTVPEAAHEFVQCDAALMKNIERTTQELRARLPRLNYLVVSPGILSMKGRTETEEGIDYKLALHYYARSKFIRDLLPLLKQAKDAGEDAKVLTILGAGKGGKIDLDDLGLKKHYTLAKAADAANTYNDLMVESFAERNPDIAFTHACPGAVRTDILKLPRILNPVLSALVASFTISVETCGENMLYALLQSKPGANRRNDKGDDIGMEGYYGSDDARTRVWEHTAEEVDTGVQG